MPVPWRASHGHPSVSSHPRNQRAKNESSPGGIWFYRGCAASVILALILILLLHSFSVGGSASVVDRKIPFHPGEKLTYEGTWGPIPAGEVTLEVLPKETIDGIETYHFAMTTKTNAAVDLLYKIRERQDSFIDTDMTHSILYKKRTESKHPRDVIVNFDWEKREAIRSNFGEKSRSDSDPAGFVRSAGASLHHSSSRSQGKLGD